MTEVAVVKAESYDNRVVENAMTEALSRLGGMEQFIKPGETVLLKINMLEGLPPDKAVSTHPEVVRALIQTVKACGAIPRVGDSPAISTTEKAAEKCGIAAICREENTELIPFRDTVAIAFSDGHLVHRFTIAQAVRAADKVISVAKMKTHSLTGVTGAVKNLFGCIVGPDKAQFHLRMKRQEDFAAMLVDLAGLINPVLYIVDGIIGMEGRGPRNGTPVAGGVLLAGANGFAVDLVMANIMGLSDHHLPVAARALELRLTPQLSALVVTGGGRDIRHHFQAAQSYSSLDHRLPKALVAFARNRLTALPEVDEHCIACGRCVEHCPPQAISIKDGRAYIDYDACIRCYCCQELCPANAVCLRESKLLQLVRRYCQK